MAHNHLADIIAGTVTRTNIIGLRKLFNADWRKRRGYSYSTTAPAMGENSYHVAALADAIRQHKPRADAQLEATGRARLTDKRYAKRWNVTQRHVIDNLDHFRLVNFVYEYGTFQPVWRAVATDGTWFDFIAPSWQSGGNGPEAY